MLLFSPYSSYSRTRRTKSTPVRIAPLLLYRASLRGTSEHKDSYPPLNPAQVAKLKHLSLASFAMQRRVRAQSSKFPPMLTSFQILPYATLQSALDLPSIRALEDVIIDAIYLDIIRGKLDQKQQQFQVEWVMGRDLAPGALEDLLKGLQEWYETPNLYIALKADKSPGFPGQTQHLRYSQNSTIPFCPCSHPKRPKPWRSRTIPCCSRRHLARSCRILQSPGSGTDEVATALVVRQTTHWAKIEWMLTSQECPAPHGANQERRKS